MSRTRVLLLPGRGNSGPDHWQTYWEQAFPNFERVLQSNWETPDVSDWIRNLHEAIARDSRPAIFVAHSLLLPGRTLGRCSLRARRGCIVGGAKRCRRSNVPTRTDRLYAHAVAAITFQEHRRREYE